MRVDSPEGSDGEGDGEVRIVCPKQNITLAKKLVAWDNASVDKGITTGRKRKSASDHDHNDAIDLLSSDSDTHPLGSGTTTGNLKTGPSA